MMEALLKEWLALLALIISLGGTVYAWLTSSSRVNSSRIEDLTKTNNGMEKRIHDLENEMKHLPSKDDVVELKLTIAELKGTVGRLDESLGSVARTVRRIDDYMREGAK